jgi:hypothetical protein
LIRNNQNRRRRGGNNNGPRPQQMNGGNNYGNRLDNRQRGNASQLLEKYRALARDAQQAGDRVTAEYYLQYADHYFRVLGDYREKAPNDGRQRGRDFYEDDAAAYNNGGDDAETVDDEDDDTDRSDDRGEAAVSARGDDNRGPWRDDRGNGSAGRNRDGNRDARNDSRGEQRQRDNRPRDERPREERPREDRPRDDRNRDRRPDYQRPATAADALNDEGPIPGLPGPATLRVRRPEPADTAVRVERPSRTLRRNSDVPPPNEAATSAVVESAAPVADTDGEAVAPRRRGRPRKIVDSAPVEG